MRTFGQGFGARTHDLEGLESPGHITCYSVVLVNLEKRDVMMFHVWEGGYDGLSPAQKDMLEDFSASLGKKVAVIAEGGRSSPSRWTAREFTDAGIEVLEALTLDSGDMRWSACFEPKTRRYKLEDERGKVLYDGIPIPDYEEAPLTEKGLSDMERRVQRLKPFAGRNGDLPAQAVKILDAHLERARTTWKSDMNVGSRLLNDFMNARAKAAGFDDYCDYLDANRDNFVKAAPAEMVLRKISGAAPPLRKRFRDAGRDFRKVHITPDAVAELLKDHPRVFDRFVEQLAAQKEAKKKPAATPAQAV
ncbi:MAG: hypothetical protein ACAH83_13180 [Alphaproteobacteria bacterium]